MKQWFEALSEREKQLVVGAGIVFAIGLFFQLIWGPVNSRLEKAEMSVQNKQTTLAWVNEKLTEYKQLKGSQKQVATGSLSQIVNNAARRANISLARMQPQGDTLQVQIDEIEFNAFIRWLADLTQNQGLTIEAVDISEAEKTGAVRVRRLQVSK
ncbi:type II secretion system protein M [Catenovulum sp. 2E275]|uniref:type II secretion system protein M n=1 Tax=Catenovulum sp. 2E275 TaxID=2980497 RepID=UPI0021CE52DA|nr:type II secretion system protein M [Catenovulum sp. 2E275]MCU4674385.1 type II secretion system protein M [Catenovulum sp. 2E275]